MKSIDEFLRKYDGGLPAFELVHEKEGIPLKIKGDKSELTYCPLYNDTKPSYQIYLNENGKWCYKDYGTNPDGENLSGDVFDFTSFYYQIDLKQLPKLIEKLQEELKNYKPSEIRTQKEKLRPPKKQKWNYRLKRSKDQQKAKEYLFVYGIIIEDHNDVYQVDGVEYLNEDGNIVKSIDYNTSNNQFYIAFVSHECAKIYCPKPKKFWYEGTKPHDYHFGDIDFAEVGATLVIVSGEKDRLTLVSIGIDAICLSSETAKIPFSIKSQIYECCRNAVILYDTDETGRAEAIKRSKESGYPVADLSLIVPDEFKDRVKDVSDYIKCGFDKKVLIDFLNGFSGIEPNGNSDEIIDEGENGMCNDSNGNNDFKDSVGLPYKGIAASIYEKLPPFLREVCGPIDSNHERDLVLLSSLCVLSNIIPVEGIYGRKKCYPNLLFFVVGSASAGKGAMRWARKLVEVVHKGMAAEYYKQLEEYKKLDEKERKKSKKPQLKKYIIPGNASVAALTKQLSKNGGIGTIIESEADTLNVAMKQEWGNYSDLLRKAHEFETISSIRNDEDNSYEIESPRLSVVITGTANQLVSFIPSTENGLFSRFMFMEMPFINEWISQFSNPIDLEEHYTSLGNRLNTFYSIEKKARIVELTDDQIEQFDMSLEDYQKQLNEFYEDDIVASVRRLGGIQFRICMLLTGLRFYNDFKVAKNWEKGILKCTDVDFEISKEIIGFLIQNLKTVYNYIPTPEPLDKKFFNQKQAALYHRLNDKFTFVEVKAAAKELNISRGTDERYLKKFQQWGLAERITQGNYRKVKK